MRVCQWRDTKKSSLSHSAIDDCRFIISAALSMWSLELNSAILTFWSTGNYHGPAREHICAILILGWTSRFGYIGSVAVRATQCCGVGRLWCSFAVIFFSSEVMVLLLDRVKSMNTTFNIRQGSLGSNRRGNTRQPSWNIQITASGYEWGCADANVEWRRLLIKL